MHICMKSKRLSFNKLRKDDLEDLVSIYTNSRVREYLGGELSESSAYQKSEELILNPPKLFWILKDKTDRFVGIIELDSYHGTDDIEISYQLNPDYWGRGYASEALAKITVYSFEELSLKKIVAETQSKNKKSIQLLEREKYNKVKELYRFGELQLLFEKYA